MMQLPAEVHNLLYFDHHQLAAGNYFGLISGHWIHADNNHIAWNVSALAILASIIEIRSRQLLLLSLAVGMICVNILLLSPLGTVLRYCGLSGALNTLFGIVLILYWIDTRSRIVLAVAVLSITKVIYEVTSGDAIFSNTSWPPFASAHIAGLIGAPIAWMIFSIAGRGLREQRHKQTLLRHS